MSQESKPTQAGGQQSVDRQSTGILEQRRIEAAIVKPLVSAFEKELGHDATRKILADVIRTLAEDTGRQLADQATGNSLLDFAETLEPWTRGGALEIDVLEQSAASYSFNVTRCRYAEMYRELGLDELGFTLSCNRDGSLIAGFSDEIEFKRTQTIMEGASHCDFRYTRKSP